MKGNERGASAADAIPVVIAIVSFNTRDILHECLTSIVPEADSLGCRVVVVDNASSDQSAAMVRREFPSVRCVALPENVGFALATNIAVAQVCASAYRYVLLLNSDVVMPAGALTDLLAYADDQPDAGAFACALRHPDGALQESCFHLPRLGRRVAEATALHLLFRRLTVRYQDWPFSSDRDVEDALGALLLVRSDAWQAVGGLGSAFFLYAEDHDLCWRLAQHRVRLRFTPRIVVTHYGGASSAFSTDRAKARLLLSAQAVAYRQWYGPSGAVLVHLCEAAYAVLRSTQLLLLMAGRRPPGARQELRSLAQTLKWVLSGCWLWLAVTPGYSQQQWLRHADAVRR